VCDNDSAKCAASLGYTNFTALSGHQFRTGTAASAIPFGSVKRRSPAPEDQPELSEAD
jgi:hypothetical protein